MSKKTQYANLFLYVLMIFVSQNVHAISLKSDQYYQHQSVISNSSIMNHSSKFKHRSTAAQPSPIGRSSSGKYKNIGGFWHPFMTDQHQSNTYFLIVAGGGKKQNLLWFTTEFLSNRFYRILIRHDYTHDQIMYISDHSYDYDSDGDGTPEIIVDDHNPSVEDIKLYLENFYSEDELILNENSRLIIYLNDHGGTGKIKISAGDYLEAGQLDDWLDNLQNKTHCQVVVIAEACRSGTFIVPLSPDEGQKRILISSSNTGVSRYEEMGIKSFSNLLFDSITQGANLKYSFEFVCDQMKKYFKYFKFQTPVLIDGHGDKKFAAQFKICTIKGDSLPEITDSTTDTTIEAGLLSFFVKASDIEGSIVVWATVVKPDFVIPEITIDFETPIIKSERIELLKTDEQNTYQGEYDFQCNGSYLLTFYAKDDIENIASKEIQITVQNGIDCLADLNNDLNIDLMDAITALNFCSNMNSKYTITASTSDVNKDGYIGLEEVIYIFQKIAKQ